MWKCSWFKRARVVFTGIVIVSLGACSRDVYMYSSFHEPADQGLRLMYSYDGYKWTDLNHIFLKPEIGAQKIMRDASIQSGPDGTFHLVWTTGWKGTKGFGYSSSRDLIHWAPERSVEVMGDEPSAVNVWAPELFYDEEAKQFVIIWASTVPFRFEKGQEDEYNNHRLYYTVTKDFKTFSKAKLFMDPGFSVIDAVIVKQAPGKYVLVLKDNTRMARNIKVAFSDHVLGPYTNVSPAFTAFKTEGPSVVHPGKEWLIYYDSYGNKKFGAAKTYDFKTFTDASSEVDVPEGHKHGTIFKASRAQLRKLKKLAGQ